MFVWENAEKLTEKVGQRSGLKYFYDFYIFHLISFNLKHLPSVERIVIYNSFSQKYACIQRDADPEMVQLA